MIHDSEEKLWEGDPMKALIYEGTERRKKLNFWSRFIITMFVVATFLILVWLLFFATLPDESRDLLNILMGAYVAVLGKSTDYWFKEKDDPEHKEMEQFEKSLNGHSE
jgi:cytochrome c biogenesis protein CcdA